MLGVVLSEARQTVRARHPRGPADVPRGPEQITPEWLTAVLCTGTPGAMVLSVRMLGGSSGTTTRRTIELTYDAAAPAELPRRVFAKFTSGIVGRLMLGLGGLIDGEPGFYMQVRPTMEIEAPIGYFAAVDPRSWRSVVLMEDVVSTRGAAFWNPEVRLSRERVQDLLASAAAWHGALWQSPRLDTWPWLKTPGEQMRVIDSLIRLADRTPHGTVRAREVIPPSLRDRQVDLRDGLRRSMMAAAEGPHTYLHGDLHVANTYTTSAERTGICDWQVGLRGSWAHDYASILVTALAVEDRRRWERELLAFYLECLAHAGGPVIPPGEAFERYRQATLYPYFAWVYTLGRSRLQPRFQPDEVSLTMIGRIAGAIDDLDSLRAVGL